MPFVDWIFSHSVTNDFMLPLSPFSFSSVYYGKKKALRRLKKEGLLIIFDLFARPRQLTGARMLFISNDDFFSGGHSNRTCSFSSEGTKTMQFN